MSEQQAAGFALSMGQRRLWSPDHAAVGGPAFTLRRAYRLRGPLDRAALATALRAVVAGHEALRTRYGLAGGEPYQVVDAPGRSPFAWTDLTGETDPERSAAEFVEPPFDLIAGPLFRARLIGLSADDHVLLLTAHEGVADNWSMLLVERDLRAAYTGGPAAVPRPPARYGDFADRQRDHVAGLTEHLGYWRRQLAGAPPVLELPGRRRTPPTYRGGRIPFTLPADLARRLRRWDEDEDSNDVLPAMVAVLAGFQAVLARRAGVNDLVVGVPVPGRPWAEYDGVVGPFAGRVMLRGDLSGDPAFAELVDRVRDTVLDAHTYQDLPFEALLDDPPPYGAGGSGGPGAPGGSGGSGGPGTPGDSGRQPIAQVWFEVAEAGPGLDLPGLEVSPFPTAPITTRFDIELRLTGDGSGELVYAVDLFDRSSMAGLADDLLALLSAAAADPRIRVAEAGPSPGTRRPDPPPGAEPYGEGAGDGTAVEHDGRERTDTQERADDREEADGCERADGREEADGCERVIARIWRDALCVDRVGRHDDFFELGGHSRLAIKVADRLRDAFHADLPLRVIFDHRTVAELATVITARTRPAPTP
ncbi:condensation domain-containing protein [Streptosporangium sp. NPDC006007]|uniref:condensation domain-containing protein n=1 Tax=Streptosporangium sp. NPDC006007 TaxID=3154575 RepID=UPI0033B199F9